MYDNMNFFLCLCKKNKQTKMENSIETSHNFIQSKKEKSHTTTANIYIMMNIHQLHADDDDYDQQRQQHR